ncbi:hypothetical protein PIB30_094391, partial [Stylosanthes scabra]|nr:hypothetical protein [Stylosanthes scabra]
CPLVPQVGVGSVWMDDVDAKAEDGQAAETELHPTGGAVVMGNSEASMTVDSNGVAAEAANNGAPAGEVSSAVLRRRL